MTVTVYRSTDASAPVLSGSAGALAGVLDACLVNGYGSKSAAGWAIEFTGTNLRAYRPPSGGNRFRLRLDDTGTTIGRVVGYETMTDINTGTGDFPTAAQFSGGLYWTKSASADATARPWVVIATDRFVHVLINSNSSATSPTSSYYCFGDITTYKSGDAYHTILIGSTAAAHAVATSRGWAVTSHPGTAVTQYPGHYIARAVTGTGTSVQHGKLTYGLPQYNNSAGVCGMGTGTAAYDTSAIVVNGVGGPETATNGFYLAPVLVYESYITIRGLIPGLWNICAQASIGTHGDTFSGGTGALSGKTFDVYKFTTGAVSGQVAIETSNTW